MFQPKNATHRDAVRKSTTVGLPIHGEQRTQTFPEGFIEEALIISDLFELNELAALELLIAGGQSTLTLCLLAMNLKDR